MDWASKNSLQEKLEQLQQYGTKWHILSMTLTGTSKRLLMGLESGQFTLDFVHEGWLCWLHQWRFASFCKARNFAFHSENWGKVKITRAIVGNSVEQTLGTVKDCFGFVYRIDSQFKLELLGVGLQPAKSQKN